MLLATYDQHALPRGQMKARSREEESEVEVRPLLGVQRHNVEQIIETFVPVQVLDALVPQMGTQLVEFRQKLDTATPEQVIEVPKLSQDRIPRRFAVRRPQKGEQLVEVPTVLSFSSLEQQSAEQIIDIPAPRRRRGQGGLQGLRPEHRSTASISSAERTSERIVEQNVDIPVSGGGLHVLPDPGGSSSSAVSRDERGDVVFRTFHWVNEKSEGCRHSESEGARWVELMDSGGFCEGSGWGLRRGR